MPTPRDQLNEARLEIARLRAQIEELTKAKAEAHREAIDALEKSGLWYFIAKGRARRGEPLYAVQIVEPQLGGGENKAVDGDDLLEVTARAIALPRSWLGRQTKRQFTHG